MGRGKTPAATGGERRAQAAPYCQALSWLPLGGRRYPVLPRLAAVYFLGGVVLLTAGLLALEAAVGYAGRRLNLLAVNEWKAENRLINENVAKKILKDRGDRVWRSKGIDPPLHKQRTRRILVVGDSFVWGDGYANINDTWWRQLERELRRRGYGDVDVIAAGTRGASTGDEVRFLTEGDLVGKYGADAVILGFVANDPDEKVLARPLPLTAEAPVAIELLRQFTPRIASLAEDRWITKERAKQGRSYDQWVEDLYRGENWTRYARTVSELAALREDLGVPFFVLTLPNLPSRPQFKAKFDRAAALFRREGIPFCDSLDPMVRRFPDFDPAYRWNILSWGINPANGHPGPISTRFYAETAADILERDYPEVLGARSGGPLGAAPRLNDWLPAELDLQPAGEHRWRFVYPARERGMPELPLDRRHVLLSLENPVPIRAVRLKGATLAAAGLWVTRVDPATGIEERRPESLGTREGGALQWDLATARSPRPVNTLRIWAEAGDAPLTLEILPGGGPRSP